MLFVNLTLSYFRSSYSHANLKLFTSSKVRDDYETCLVVSHSGSEARAALFKQKGAKTGDVKWNRFVITLSF